MICEYAKEHGCVKQSCFGCHECVHPIVFDNIGTDHCFLCDRIVIVPLLGSLVEITTTRTDEEIKLLDYSAMKEIRVFHGVIEEEQICNKIMTHDVLICGLWVSIMSNGIQVRNVRMIKRNRT